MTDIYINDFVEEDLRSNTVQLVLVPSSEKYLITSCFLFFSKYYFVRKGEQGLAGAAIHRIQAHILLCAAAGSHSKRCVKPWQSQKLELPRQLETTPINSFILN